MGMGARSHLCPHLLLGVHEPGRACAPPHTHTPGGPAVGPQLRPLLCGQLTSSHPQSLGDQGPQRGHDRDWKVRTLRDHWVLSLAAKFFYSGPILTGPRVYGHFLRQGHTDLCKTTPPHPRWWPGADHCARKHPVPALGRVTRQNTETSFNFRETANTWSVWEIYVEDYPTYPKSQALGCLVSVFADSAALLGGLCGSATSMTHPGRHAKGHSGCPCPTLPSCFKGPAPRGLAGRHQPSTGL